MSNQSTVIDQGIYIGIEYEVVLTNGKKNIALPSEIAIKWRSRGISLDQLNNIGEQNPEAVLGRIIDSLMKTD